MKNVFFSFFLWQTFHAMMIGVGKSHVSLMPGSGGQVDVTLRSLGDAWRLRGFRGAFSYAVDCLTEWNPEQRISVPVAQAANFLAANLQMMDSQQLNQLIDTPLAGMPAIARVIRAGNPDARANVLQFFQDGARGDLLKQALFVPCDGGQQEMTLAQLIYNETRGATSNREAVADPQLEQFNRYCSANNIQLTVEQTDAGARAVADGGTLDPVIPAGDYTHLEQTYDGRKAQPLRPNPTRPGVKLTFSQMAEKFLTENDLTSNPVMCARIRNFSQDLAQLADFLKTEHPCHEIEAKIRESLGDIPELRLLLDFAREVSSTDVAVRASLPNILRGVNGRSLPDLLPLGSPIRNQFAEPLCREFGIPCNEPYTFTRYPGESDAAASKRLCEEIDKLLNLNTPESIYKAISLLGDYRELVLDYARKSYDGNKMLEKIFDEIPSAFEKIKPFTHHPAWEKYNNSLNEMGTKIRELSRRVPIPLAPIPPTILSRMGSAQFVTYMRQLGDYVEGLLRWYDPEKAYKAFLELRLNGDDLQHLPDAEVERLNDLLTWKPDQGQSLMEVSSRMPKPASRDTDIFSKNRECIAKRLAWTETKINAALDATTSSNIDTNLLQGNGSGVTLLDAVSKFGTAEHKAKLTEILLAAENDKFATLLSHRKLGRPLSDLLATNDAMAAALRGKLEALDSEQFLKALDGSPKIFEFLRRDEAGCALLERRFEDHNAFIKLIEKPWFGQNELSFFTSFRGTYEVGDVDRDGNPITRTEWVSGVADPQFFSKVAQEPGVLHAAMQRQNLWFPFVQSLARRTGTKIENILNAETFIALIQTPQGAQIFENIHTPTGNNKTSKVIARNLFTSLLQNKEVVRELSKISWIGGKLIAALNEFKLLPVDERLLRPMCFDALSSPGPIDEAVWGKILETPKTRTILWGVCNELAQQYGPQAQVFFSRLTQSETFRRLAIGHEPGHCYPESSGLPEIFAEMGTALSSPAKRMLLLGRMSSETTYGGSYTQYGGATQIPELLRSYENSYHANFAQEALRRHSEELFAFLDGMDAKDVNTVLSTQATNGCTPLQFAVLNRRDSTVMKLADYHRQRRVPFSRVGLREMLVFKKAAFRATVGALIDANRLPASVLASIGSAATANPTRAEWSQIARQFTPQTNPGDWFERRAAAFEEVMRQKREKAEVDQGQILELISIYKEVIADGKDRGKDVTACQEILDGLLAKSSVGVSGRIELAEADAKEAFEQYMDRLIGVSPNVVQSASTTLDAKILNATKIELTGRGDTGWIARIDGAEVRVENIADLAQCQQLETITFSSFANQLTADELFSLRHVPSLKRLDLGRFSTNLTPNLVEILFRARLDLTITAILADERTLVWAPRPKPNLEGSYSYSHVLRPGVRL
ncbi:MAG: hypothetical protein LBB26_03555 [Puniceicoccales bacterium]|jgi:hypothetical protein|nr:hypothetical protein [Puniceicoccales bacterium]